MILDKILANLSVTVRPFALVEVASGWRIKLPEPPETLLHFVLRGSGRIGLSRRSTRDLMEGYMAVVPAGSYHALEAGDPVTEEFVLNAVPSAPGVHRVPVGSATDKELVVACGLVDVRYGLALNLFHGLNQTLVVDLSMVPQVRSAIDMIFAEQQHPVSGSTTMTSALMLQCLLHMFRRLPSEGDRALSWLIALRDARLSRVIESVIDDPAANHTVESLSEEAAMSRSAFAALFTRSFDRTPMSFVHHIRMQRASELLEGTILSVDQVAARVGFSSRSHFAQSFKKHTGLSPHSFRDEMGGRIV
jgi:AraC family transcriptional activator of mtrCDE